MPRRILPGCVGVGVVAAVLCGLFWPAAITVAAPSASRETQLRYMLEQDCGSCHGLTRKGGLGTPLTPSALRERSDDYLAHVIRHGIPGKPMPPWGPLLSDDDIQALIRMLRHGEES